MRREGVRKQAAIVADADRHRNTRMPQFDPAHLPALDQPIAPERQQIDNVQRQVVTDIETAVYALARSIVGIRPGGGPVV